MIDQKINIMKKNLLLYFFVLFSFGLLKAQYCVTNLGGFCGSAEISNFSISGTSLNNSSGCISSGGQAYTYFPPTAGTFTTLIKGQQYTLNITVANGTPNDVKVYIDFNKDGDWFDAGETIVVCSSCPTQTTYSAVFTVSTSAVTDTTRIRVRTRQATIADACENMGSGETEDYLVFLDPGTPCVGTPIAGTTQSNDTAVCIGQVVNFSMNGLVPAGNLTYQWQKNGVNLVGDTNSFLADTISGPDAYQCIVTCTNSGFQATSTPLSVTINSFSQCYCDVTNGSTFGTDIGNFTVGSFSNGSASPQTGNANATNIYTNFTNLPAIQMLSGIPNGISISGISDNTFVSFITLNAYIYIDLNQDGAYDPITELVFSGIGDYSSATSSIISGNAVIPASALSGNTGLRVMLFESSLSGACFIPSFTGGETEDYTVNIQPAAPCSGTPSIGNALTSDTLVCPTTSVSLSLSSSTLASGITYQWQSASTLAGPYTNMVGDTSGSISTSVTAATYYQCVITCTNSGQTATSTPVFVNVKPFNLCYCNTNLSGSCSPNAQNVVFNTINNPSTTCNLANNQAYTIFPDTAAFLTTTLIKGATYPLSLFSGGGAPIQITAFIDYNRDGIFNNTNERIDILPANFSNTQTSFSVPVNIPTTADSGLTGFRIRIRASSFNDACDPLGSGETEDYTIRISDGISCSGIPTAGSTAANDTSVCIGQVVNFTLNGFTPGAGLTYQWQENGVNIPGATSSFLTDTISGASTYQCVITCTNSSQTATSTPLVLTINPFSQCYCAITSASTFGTDIGNVTVGAFTNGTATPVIGNFGATNVYTNFTGLGPIPLLSGIPNAISVSAITSSTFTGGTNLFNNVYIDYNQDGTFDPLTELAFSSTGNYATPTSSILNGLANIPTTALTGTTGMRIMLYESSIFSPCATPSFSGGETEDYTVDIQLAVPCSGIPNAGVSTVSDTLVCPSSNVALALNGASLASGISFQWQSATSISGPYTNLVGDTTLNASDNPSVPTYYQCIVTCSNSGQSTTSTPIFVDIKPFNLCYCNTNLGGNCSPNAEQIVFNTLNNPSTICNQANGQAYTLFPDTAAFLTTTLIKGATYPLSLVSNGVPIQITAFIDYNRDGIFNNTNERIDILPANFSNTQTVFSIPVTIPTNADSGATGFRIRIRASSFNDACDQLGSGETEDYTIRIIDGIACTGAPVAGTAVSSDTLVCANNTFNLSLNGNTIGAGLTYQWFANGVAILGDTLPIVSNVSQSINTIYTCTITCTSSSQSTTSSSVTVNMDTPINCACTPTYTNGCSGDHIASVSINGITNFTGPNCPTPPYTSFSTPIMSANPGDTTICVFEHGVTFQHYINVWIDYNNDFSFSAAEQVITNLNMATGSTTFGTYFIASTNPSDTGIHRMRVLQYYTPLVSNPSSCGTYSYGETEDYLINISDTVTTYTSLGKALSRQKDFSISVFPNPTTGIVNYNLPVAAKSAKLKVADLLGRVLLEKSDLNASKTLDLSSFKNGTYMISFSLDGRTYQSKIVLNK